MNYLNVICVALWHKALHWDMDWCVVWKVHDGLELLVSPQCIDTSMLDLFVVELHRGRACPFQHNRASLRSMCMIGWWRLRHLSEQKSGLPADYSFCCMKTASDFEFSAMRRVQTC